MNAAPPGFDAADLRRLRWRARRGLLENDIIIGRFFDRHAESLDPAGWRALQDLLALDDPPLFDLLLGTAEPPPQLQGDDQLRVLRMLREV
jgi:antitoxin CptB